MMASMKSAELTGAELAELKMLGEEKSFCRYMTNLKAF